MTSAAILFAAFILAGPDRSAEVVMPAAAEPSTRLAVSELTNYVAKITGRVLKTGSFDPSAAKGGRVVVGTLKTLGAAVPKAAKDALAKAKQYEASWTGTVDGDIWVVGREDVAELYAMYHFLETKLGVRWFQASVPEDPGDWYPSSPVIEIADFACFREPDFEVRRLDMCSAYWYQVPKAGKECAIRNGFQAPTSQNYFKRNPQRPDFYDFYAPRQSRREYEAGGGHLMFTAPAPEAAFEKNPDWFALRGGKRVKGHQYCFSSEGLLRKTADGIIAALKSNDGKGSYLFGQADVSHGWCECAGCRALDPPGTDYDATVLDISTRFYKMCARVSEMVRAELPDADLRYWAYNNYRTIPDGITLDASCKLQFCDHGRCYAHRLDDPSCVRNVKMFALMKKWLKAMPKMYTYEYFNCTPPRYVCRENDEARDLRLYKSLGMIGWKNEACFTGSKFVGRPDKCEVMQSNWQWLYTTGHLLWDVDRDVAGMLEDAESKYYGAAYPAMKKYHAFRRKLWAETPGCMGYPFDDPKRPTILGAKGAKEKLLALLDEADRLAAGDAVRAFRLKRDRLWLGKYWIKPNEKIVEEERRAIKVEPMRGKISIDGVGDEEAWKSAPYVDKFLKTVGTAKGFIPPLDKRLYTKVKVLRDEENFYFLAEALEPTPEKMAPRSGRDNSNWAGDGIELMLAPPAIDCRYYQVVGTPSGGCFDASHPGCVVSDDFGVETAAKIHADRYVVEMRVSVKRMHPLNPGETWRIMFGRNRTITDEICPNHWDHNFTVGGCGYHDISNFTPVKIR